MKNIISAIFMTFFALGVSAQKMPKVNETELRAAFTNLKDQPSARFRDIKLAPRKDPGAWTICGEVNSKNSYGGYEGFNRFMGIVFEGESNQKKLKYMVLTQSETADPMCAIYGL